MEQKIIESKDLSSVEIQEHNKKLKELYPYHGYDFDEKGMIVGVVNPAAKKYRVFSDDLIDSCTTKSVTEGIKSWIANELSYSMMFCNIMYIRLEMDLKKMRAIGTMSRKEKKIYYRRERARQRLDNLFGGRNNRVVRLADVEERKEAYEKYLYSDIVVSKNSEGLIHGIHYYGEK